MSDQKDIWTLLTEGPRSKGLLDTAMGGVARGLSGMIGQPITNDTPQVKKMLAAQGTMRAGAAEMDVIGIYLKMERGLRGQAVLMLPLPFALSLVDLLMDAPRGTTTKLDLEGRSALAEVGNLTISYFLNAVARLVSGMETLQPSPPAVIVDTMARVLNMIAIPVAVKREELLVIETVFRDLARILQIRFWVLPA